MIYSRTFEAPDWDRREIMRYARIRGADDSYRTLIEACIAEAEPVLSYRVCYTVLPVEKRGEELSLGNMRTSSKTISSVLCAGEAALLFAATVGTPFDRLIHRYSLLSPSKALVLQAIGAERVEALCDAFCAEFNTELNNQKKCLTRRVSPGYGDIPIEMQRDIFAILDCPRKIGLTLEDSLMMSPSKSVTALCGIADNEPFTADQKCSGCSQKDCVYRVRNTK